MTLEEQLAARRHRIQTAAANWRRYRIKYRAIAALKKLPGQRFASFSFPIIRNMNVQGLMEQLVAVQPMNMPQAAMYMDIVMGPRMRRAREREPHLDYVENPKRYTRPFLRTRLDEVVPVNETELRERERKAAVRAAMQTVAKTAVVIPTRRSLCQIAPA